MSLSNLQPVTSIVEDVLRRRSIVTYFQPILSARQKAVVGVEALSRGQLGPEHLIAPASLFKMADGDGVTDELQTLCHHQAIETFAELSARTPDLLLFLNMAAPVTSSPALVVDHLQGCVQGAGLKPGNIAVEILEAEVTDKAMLGELIRILRAAGFLIVLDDVGAGHSNLDRVSLLHPDILKIDRSLISHVDTDFHQQGTLKSLIDLSRKIGALVVAEGIETEREAIVALELGADLLQGFHLGRPSAVDPAQDMLASARENIATVAQRFKGYMVGKINDRKLEHRRFTVVVNEILCDLTGSDLSHFDDILGQTIARYPGVECIYVLDHSGVQVTDTICNPAMTRRDGTGIIFRPAPRGTDHSLKEYYYILLDVELNRYTTDPYVSLATGNISRTISTYFRDALTSRMYVLCVDVRCD